MSKTLWTPAFVALAAATVCGATGAQALSYVAKDLGYTQDNSIVQYETLSNDGTLLGGLGFDAFLRYPTDAVRTVQTFYPRAKSGDWTAGTSPTAGAGGATLVNLRTGQSTYFPQLPSTLPSNAIAKPQAVVGYPNSQFLAVNAQGQAVGYAVKGDAINAKAISYTAAGGITDLGLSKVTSDAATGFLGINDSGQVVATSSAYTYNPYYFLNKILGFNAFEQGHHGAVRTFVLTPGAAAKAVNPLPASKTQSIFPVAINRAGVVLGNQQEWIQGTSSVLDVAQPKKGGYWPMTAFVWTAAGGTKALASLPGATCTQAMALNDRGEAVGNVYKADTSTNPAVSLGVVFWDASGQPHDITASIKAATASFNDPSKAASDRGTSVTAVGLDNNGNLLVDADFGHRFLLSPGP